MAENNEEQYLDELLNSLRSSNTSVENDVEQDSEQDSEKSAVDTDIVLDDGTEVIDNAGAENGLYDDIGPIIDEPQTDDIGPIIDEPQTDDIGPIIDESPADEEVPSADGQPQTKDEPVNEAPSAGDEADENTSGESSSDDIFALEDNFDISDENDESAAGTDEENQPDDVPLTLTEPDDAQPETTESIGQDDSDDDSDDGLMQLLNQINGEDGKHEEKPDNAAGADKSHNETKAKDAKSDKAAREEEKERKKAEKLAKKEQRRKEKEEKKKNKNKKDKTDNNASEQTDESAADTGINSASQENIDLINELYSDTESLDNAPLGDDLADIPERDAEEEEPKKPKKEKKKKEPKPKKPKKEKVKKEKKAPKPSELVKVTPKTFLGIIIFAVVITVVVIFGTKIVNYSVSIKHAIEHFNNGKYDQAYDSIAGLEVKDKDKDTYYKIRTVMSVYVDYTSYISYKQLGMNVEALDSLIRGLGHYDDYYSDAEKYDVVAQYDGVKDTITAALAQYGVSEEDARYYAGLESEQQYEEILNNIGGRIR